jgi:hypothetical protein
MSLADDAIIVENGTITEFGSIDLLRASAVAGLQPKSPLGSDEDETSPNDDEPLQTTSNAAASGVEALLELNEEGQDMKRQSGDLSVYSYYSRAGGHGTVATMLVMVALWVFTMEFSGKFTSGWNQ